MSDISNSIRLNDHMSSTLRTINQTMERTISIMQRLDRELRTLGSGSNNGLNNMDTNLSAVMARVQMLETMIASIGTGAGPGTGLFNQLNAQLTAAQARITDLETQLANLGNHNNNGSQQIQELNNQLEEARRRIEQLEGDLARLNNGGGSGGGGGSSSWALNLTGLFSGMQIAQSVLGSLKQVTDIADEFTNANARLNLINDGLRTQAELQQQVLDVANNTRSSYTATASLVARMGRSGQFRGDNDGAIRFADIVNKSLTISGASTSEASSVIIQLSQAMSSGVLRGEEFNAVMENGSRLAEALSTELGVSVGGLRQMAMDGELTADVVADAIMRAGETIDAEFSKMPRTFGQNMVVMRNILGGWLGDMAKAEGALGKLNQVFTNFVNYLQNSAVFDSISAALFVVAHIIEIIAGGISYLMQLIDTLGPVFDAVVNTIIILLLIEAAIAMKTLIAGFILGIHWATLLGQAVALLNSPIFLVAAAIGIVIAALNHMGFTANDILTFIGGLFGGLVALVANVGIFFINTFLALSEFVGNVFQDPVYAVQMLFYTMVDNILGFLNGLIGAITDGLNWLINKVNDVTGLKVGNIAEWVIENPLMKPTSDAEDLFNYDPLDYVNYNNWANKGAELATGFVQKLGDKEIPGVGGMGAMPDIGNVDKVGKVGKIDDDVNIADEDMKMLMELAIQNRVNQINLTVQTTNSPNVTQYNTVSNELDIAAVANEFAAGVYESSQVTVEQDY